MPLETKKASEVEVVPGLDRHDRFMDVASRWSVGF
jgi:hypothetical protein